MIQARASRLDELHRQEFTQNRFSNLVNSMGVQRRPLPPGQPPNVLRDYTVIPMTLQAPRRADCTPQGDPYSVWWTLTANAREVARQIEVQERTPAELLDWSEIGALHGGYDSTDIQIELSWDADTAIVDIGAGIQLSLLAPTITANLWIPSTVVARNANTSQVRTGIALEPGFNQILESLVSVGLTASDAPLGSQRATCTRTYLVGDTDIPQLAGVGAVAPTPSTFQVPPRAQRVTFYVPPGQAAPGVAAGVAFFRSPIADTPFGLVDAWGRNVSPRVQVPQNASIIQLFGFDPADQVTAVWELDL